MIIDSKRLIQIAEIVDQSSFTEAAKRLGTSQPALSRMATELETRLGAPLFSSRRNPVIPTALGRELADSGRSIRASTDSVSRLVDRITSGAQGELAIGAPPFHSERIFSRFIAQRIKAQPDVRIVLHADYAQGLQAKLIDGKLDLILAPVELIEGGTELLVERIIHDENVIVCRAGHPLLAVPKVTTEMLSDARWIGYARESNLHRDTRLALAAAGIERVELPTFESTSAGAVRTVLSNSDMLIVLPGLVAADLVGSGDFAILPFQLPGPHRPIGYATHKARQTPALRSFREALRVELAAAGAYADAMRRAAFDRIARA
ncbi:MAG: LysR family transcriptional regulator [Alphaproteobacteria bacterium]|nr:LysR family transcriptional regulator [Alphaproteobacteria bacterium]